MLPKVHGEFRVVADPTLRFTPGGMAVAEFRVVADKKKKDEASGEWVDDKVCWLTVVCFKKVAENVAESVQQRSLVTVTGNLQTESWETQDGEKRQSYKLIADYVGVSLAFNPAKSMSGDRDTSGVSRSSAPADDDPFATPAPAAAGAGTDEPPF
jgi:single-strand DNA-binding protein